METEKIEVKTMVNRNVLIPMLDENNNTIYCTNLYGEYAVFVGEASLLNSVDKSIKLLRFKSSIFEISSTSRPSNLSRMWDYFETLVKQYAESHKDKFDEKLSKPIELSLENYKHNAK